MASSFKECSAAVTGDAFRKVDLITSLKCFPFWSLNEMPFFTLFTLIQSFNSSNATKRTRVVFKGKSTFLSLANTCKVLLQTFEFCGRCGEKVPQDGDLCGRESKKSLSRFKYTEQV